MQLETRNFGNGCYDARDFMGQIFPIALVLALTLAGCMEPAETGAVSDDKNPWLKKAEGEMQQRNYAQAAEYYEKALQLNPASQRAHWSAAMLYEQHLNDFASAIYHYQRFIQLKPEAARIKMANEFVERAKYSMATSLPNTPVEGAGEFKQLQDKNKSLQEEIENLRQRLAEAEMKLANQPRVVAVTQPSPADPVVAPPPAPSAAPPVQPDKNASKGPTAGNTPPPPPTKTLMPPKAVVSNTTKTRTYTVRAGDTLASIAEKFYGDRKAYPVIYKANKSAIPDQNKLLIGTVLTIPARRSR